MKKITLVLFFFIVNCTLIVDNCKSQWVQTSGPYGRWVYSLAVSGTNIFAGASNGGVFLSTNNGTNWTATGLTNQTVSSLAVSGTNIFAGTTGDGVFLSTNNGTNWTAVNNGLTNQNVYSLAVSGTNIFAGTYYGGVFFSTNNGQSWMQTTMNNLIVNCLAISVNNIFAGISGGGVFLSTNNGQNWTQTALNNKEVYSIAINGNNIFAGCWFNQPNGVYVSTNNGQSWTQTSLYTGAYFYSFAVSGNNIFAATSSGVWLSPNNGQTWIEKNQGLLSVSVKSLLIANNYIFAGTYEQSVWRRLYSEAIGIQNISTEIPSVFSLEQNYPNPFNPSTKIRFALPNSGYTTLKIFDILGKEITTLVNESLQPGTYQINFDGSGLTSGIYFYRMTAGDYVETKKMILIK